MKDYLFSFFPVLGFIVGMLAFVYVILHKKRLLFEYYIFICKYYRFRCLKACKSDSFRNYSESIIEEADLSCKSLIMNASIFTKRTERYRMQMDKIKERYLFKIDAKFEKENKKCDNFKKKAEIYLEKANDLYKLEGK